MSLAPLYDLIIRAEIGGAAKAQGVPTPYDVVSHLIAPQRRPQAVTGKRLSEMTIGEVLDWQDGIDRHQQSEAAGAFQIMEDTLRGLLLSRSIRFDRHGQETACLLLLEHCGLRDFQAGRLSVAKFGDALARTWASFPVLSPSLVIGGRTITRGRGVYDGDGLNGTTIKPADVEAVLSRLSRQWSRPAAPPAAPAPEPRPEPPPPPPSLLARILAALAALFRRPA